MDAWVLGRQEASTAGNSKRQPVPFLFLSDMTPFTYFFNFQVRNELNSFLDLLSE